MEYLPHGYRASMGSLIPSMPKKGQKGVFSQITTKSLREKLNDDVRRLPELKN
jgi:hypothetical protein